MTSFYDRPTTSGEARPTSTEESSPYLPPVMAAPPAGCTETLDKFLPNMPSPLGESSQYMGQEEMTGEPETEVFVVEAPTESLPAIERQADQVGGPDVSREGPYDVHDIPPESGQSPLILSSMPGCQYRMTSYDDRDSRVDLDPAYGIHLHHSRMMEYMGARSRHGSSAERQSIGWNIWAVRGRWQQLFDLHHDASLIMTNVQVMDQFVTSLNRTASEVMRVVYEKRPFPTDASQYVTPVRRVRRAAHYMAAMGCGAPRADRSSQVRFRYHHPTRACHVNSCMSCFPDVPV